MDHHINAAITAGLRRRGVDVLTAYEDGAAEAGDEDLLTRATQLNRALFSQDVDLLRLADQWLQVGREFAGLVYAHQLAITVGQAVRDLALLAQVLDPEDMRNRIEFLPL
jgi:hypothetical protein